MSQKAIINCSTGEVEHVLLTAEEITEMELNAEKFRKAEAERLAAAESLAALKASAKAKLVSGQPLTAEEADTLVI